MKANSFADTHWSDEQLIDSLYGVGPEGEHLRRCDVCNARQTFLLNNRQAVEASLPNAENVEGQFLAAQRRAICEKLDRGQNRMLLPGLRRWAPVSLALLLLAGGAAVYQEHHVAQLARTQPSDSQLALEVSAMSQEWQDQPAAPLQGLFE